jgi:4-hydroxy-tetrahydrodipicolinate reductase
MRRVRAVVYGVGRMGSIMTRLMLDKGVDIVGAISRSPDKVGKDLGEVAGLGFETNVIVENDAQTVLGTRAPDIAVVAVSSYMVDMFEHFRVCAANGVNAVSLSEESLYPWRTSPMATAELDKLAKDNGVTITGTGHNDVYWMNIVSLMMGTAHRVDSVVGKASWNVDDYGPEVARDQRVGDTPDEFKVFLESAQRPPTFGRNSLDALAADIGLTATSIEVSTRPEVAETDMYCRTLDLKVPAGNIVGFTDIDTIRTAEGPSLTFEMTGCVYAEGQKDNNDWVILGEPDLYLSNPAVPTQMSTCAQLVNRIPDVINAEPGFVTVDRLPKLRYRAFPLGMYITKP